MRDLSTLYINGAFVTPHGQDRLDLIDPRTGERQGSVALGDAEDARRAIAAAKAAYRTYARTSLAERGRILQRLHDVVRPRIDDLTEVMITEYGAPASVCRATATRAANAFLHAKAVMEGFAFVRTYGEAQVTMEPLGVVGLITPWNASNGFICGKMAMALAAGSTVVIKPSELSAAQTQLLLECLHEAGVPPGLFNVVNGRGDVVGKAITEHPDIAKISFTGSTAVGKAIARGAAETMKRITLELGGKSPNVILDDADLATAIPLAVRAAFHNNGQACIAGTRLLVPRSRVDEIKRLAKAAVEAVVVGDPHRPETQIGPLVTATQYERVQRYIQLGLAQGAELVTGGPGHPAGLERGYFVRPTLFAGVTRDMTIAQEEIFGPVLSLMTYGSDDEAVDLANDTVYGLQAYVSSTNLERARAVASRIVAGRVFINGLYDDPRAPFGGFKQSGIGRESGAFGLEAYLEPKAVFGTERSAS